jgi:hypothetical protein
MTCLQKVKQPLMTFKRTQNASNTISGIAINTFNSPCREPLQNKIADFEYGDLQGSDSSRTDQVEAYRLGMAGAQALL